MLGLNLGPSACKATHLPLSYSLSSQRETFASQTALKQHSTCVIARITPLISNALAQPVGWYEFTFRLTKDKHWVGTRLNWLFPPVLPSHYRTPPPSVIIPAPPQKHFVVISGGKAGKSHTATRKVSLNLIQEVQAKPVYMEQAIVSNIYTSVFCSFPLRHPRPNAHKVNMQVNSHSLLFCDN